MLLDRHRVARLVELSALERVAQGPERLLREEDVALLVKAAYDDATDGARAEFMARVNTMPTSSWPWTAVQATTARGIGSVVAAPMGGANINLAAPRPVAVTAPAALVLIRGQAESADIDLGNRLPDRGMPEALLWEPLYRALDAWDTSTLVRSIGPQGWVNTTGATAGQVPKDTGNGAPAGGVDTSPGQGGKDLPAPQPRPETPIFWTHPAVIAAGAAVVVAIGVVVYSVGQSRSRRQLEDALDSQEERP